MTQDLLLNLATWLPRSRANGPGTRMILWVQGCPFRCPDCQNPENLEFRINQVMQVEQVWQTFQAAPDLEGISFSGGEPFAQAIALGKLAQLVRSVDKTVVCWTGYRLEQLLSGKIQGAQDLLQYVDLLVDGLYVKQEAGNYSLRGSANQTLHFLSGRIQEQDLADIPRQEWIMNGETLTYTGFPI